MEEVQDDEEVELDGIDEPRFRSKKGKPHSVVNNPISEIELEAMPPSTKNADSRGGN